MVGLFSRGLCGGGERLEEGQEWGGSGRVVGAAQWEWWSSRWSGESPGRGWGEDICSNFLGTFSWVAHCPTCYLPSCFD